MIPINLQQTEIPEGQISPEHSIAEVVRSDIQTSDVFKRNQIDFCCSGKRTIADACASQGLDPAQLIAELETVRRTPREQNELVSKLHPDELIDYIVEHHHAYLDETLPLLDQYLEKLVRVHGNPLQIRHRPRKQCRKHRYQITSVQVPCVPSALQKC